MTGKRNSRKKSKKDVNSGKESSKKTPNDNRNWKRNNNRDRNNSALSIPSEKGMKSNSLRAQVPSHIDGTEIRNVERKPVCEKRCVSGVQSQPCKKGNDTKCLEWKTDEGDTKETSDDSTLENATAGILDRPPLIEPPKHDWQSFQKSLRLYHKYKNDTVSEEILAHESSSSDSEHGYIERPSSFKGKSKSSISKNSRKRIQKYQLKENKAMQPPNEYRSLSIFPGKLDITDEIPFIRPNIVEGKYENCEHYLDVQFRLFREDFINPLRESIKEYKQIVKECKEQSIGNYEIADVKKRLKVSYVYENVKITEPKLESVGLVHTLEFKPFPESYICNNRLQEGTLLFLSSDDFVNIFIFATVTNRDAVEVKKGRVQVCFEEWKHDILYDVDESRSYIMLELHSAYFESYRHTLSVLKAFDASNFPLQKYLVKTEQTVDKPCYLEDDTLYDFSPILIEENYSDKEIHPLLKEIPVLDEEEWPSQKELGLDFTQYGVLKAALTKELCIIQGPPGTGKTFMGLKIVKMLLRNSSIWCPENIERRSPILIVCYTNHALDQFLERILEFTDKLVRVGEQGESEKLKDFTLSELRINNRYSDSVFLHRKRRLEDTERYIKNQISTYNFVMEAASHTILRPEVLKNYMEEGHYRSLLYQDSNKLQILEKWLEGLDKIPESILHQDNNSSAHKFDYSDKSMHIYEICSWLKWEYHDNREQRSYGWNKRKDDKYKTIVKNIVCDVDMMDPKEVENVKDVWILDLSDRLRLYRYWIARFIASVVDEVKHLQEEFIDIAKQLKETRWGKDVAIVQKAEVVGMTCTGTAKFRHLVEAIAPKIVIVEEAAEVLEPHLITSLTKSTEHLILIGDHQQLRPLPSVHELAIRCKFDVSLFERMVRNKVEYWTLVSQHRMRPEIAELLKGSIYAELSNHENVFHYENILGIEKNLYFFSHSSAESKLDTTYYNLFEAKMVVRLTRYFLLQDYEPSQITVLAAYGGQVKMIKDERRKIVEENKSIPIEALNDVKVTTIDNYQGEENDIIIVSFVRSNYEGKIGFLKYSNRVCVALSRARKGFYCFGNFEFFASESDLWKNIVDKLKQQDAFGSCLTFICQNHLFKTDIEHSGDFKKVFDGGCAIVCNTMMKCGHVCKRLCHFIDLEHKQTVCEEQCKKHCENGHPCQKKCHEDCGKCTKLRFAQLPCGHRVPVPCNVTDLSEYHCEERCDKMLPCGHTCTKLCSAPCQPCLKKVPKTLPCRHTFVTECCNQATCTKPCHLKLPCGHLCSKRCGEPCEQKCRHDVAVKLPCGHIVTVPCSEHCDKIRCQAPCGVLLPCGHKCPGNCEKCHQGSRHVECWLTCGKSLDGRMTCKLRCGHENKCSANFRKKGVDPSIGRSLRPSIDNHIVNKWKTGYNDDE